MKQAIKKFVYDLLRILYWVFFKPSDLRAHLEQIAPGIVYEPYYFDWRRETHSNAELRILLLKVFFVMLALPLVFYLTIGIICLVSGQYFYWYFHFINVILGIVFLGIAISTFLATLSSLDELSLQLILVGGMGGGIAPLLLATIGVGTSRSFASGFAATVIESAIVIMLGLTVNVLASNLFGIVIGPLFSLSAGVIFGLFYGANRGLAYIIIGSLIWGIGAIRLPFYVVELFIAILAYRRSLSSESPERELLQSPVLFDELLMLPQAYLSSILLQVARQNLCDGLRYLAVVICNQYQSFAVKRAFRTLLERENLSFFFILHQLLSSPEPYRLSGQDHGKKVQEDDPYLTTKLLLLGLIGEQPAVEDFLRDRTQSPYAPLAETFLLLLGNTEFFADQALLDEQNYSYGLPDEYLQLIGIAVQVLENARGLPYGEEFYQSLFSIEKMMYCESLADVASLRNEFEAVLKIDHPLRPKVVTIFYNILNAAVDAASFLTAAHDITRRDALLKAQGVLEEARQLADDVYEPERSLLLAVIDHWRRMFAVEGGRVAEKAEVEMLPNPYVAGRPIRPEDGRLFAGRREEMKQIEEKLQTGVGLVIWGQRRIGKTSILLHLRERLPHDLLPVYLNLQLLMANTTGGFLHAIAREIVKQFKPQSPIRIPQSEEFDREPYLSFNHLLEEVEQRLQPGQRVLLSFDEFEELEQRVKNGKIEKDIFAYLRGVTQTGRGFALMFAGLHTLEEMTREYWNPFFQSVQTIRIGYLSELDAEQLIRNPVEQFPLDYELEAVNRITEVTRSHPYLTQSLCHNLVNRLNDPLHRSQKARREDVDAVLERTLESSGYYFDDYVWGWSGADEQLALSLLAEAGDDAAFSIVEKHLGREAALEATRKLVAREILTERTLADELVFRFQIPLARLWVRRTKSSARLLLERKSL